MSIKQKMQPVSLLERTLDEGKPITLIMDMTQVAYAPLVLKIIQYSRTYIEKKHSLLSRHLVLMLIISLCSFPSTKTKGKKSPFYFIEESLYLVEIT